MALYWPVLVSVAAAAAVAADASACGSAAAPAGRWQPKVAAAAADIPDLSAVLPYFKFSGLPVSPSCALDLAAFSAGLRSGEAWAVTMADAAAKVPVGVLQGSLTHLGSFDGCVDVGEVSWAGRRFRSQHSVVAFSVRRRNGNETRQEEESAEEMVRTLEQAGAVLQQLDGLLNNFAGLTIQMGWCLPDGCSAADVAAAGQALAGERLAVSVKEIHCHTNRPRQLSGIDIFAVCFLAFFILIAAASTAYDVLTLKKAEEGAARPPLLLAFSLYGNGSKLFALPPAAAPQPPGTGEQVPCLHGIRCLSICWVVMGHTYMINAGMPAVNGVYMAQFVKSAGRLFVMNATVSVDTFFLMSGFLLSFLFLKEVYKSKRFNVPMFYIHRYLRLTPPVAVMILMTVTLMNYSGTGALFDSRMSKLKKQCDDNWWTNLLYVNNYVHSRNQCLGQTWYLAVDMQLYWLSPLVLVPLWKWPRQASSFILFLLAAGWAIPFAVVYSKELVAGFYTGTSQQSSDMMHYYYHPTHNRFNPWLMGVLLGYLLRQSRVRRLPRLHWMWVCAGWLSAALLLLGSLLGAYPFQQPDYDYNRVEAAFWQSLFRSMWAAGVGWLVFACDQGYAGAINDFLSWRPWQLLSRLSYGIYITHLSVLALWAGTRRAPVYLADTTSLTDTFGTLVMSIAWTIPLTLLFESPVILLEKALFGRGGGGGAPSQPKQLWLPSVPAAEAGLTDGRPSAKAIPSTDL